MAETHAPKVAKQTGWRNRIVGSGEEAPAQLLSHPRNWRVHTTSQQNALLGMLREVGVVQEVLVNKNTGFLVDGHLRVALAVREGQTSIPVKYLDLSESEELLVMATFDPLGAMAETDTEKLAELLRDVEAWDSAVQDLLSKLAEELGTLPPGLEFKTYDESAAEDEHIEYIECPECHHRWPK